MLYYFMRYIMRRRRREGKWWGEQNSTLRVTSLFWVAAFFYLLVPCFRSSFLEYLVYIMFTSTCLLRSFVCLCIKISPYFFSSDVSFVRDVITVILIYIGLQSEMGSLSVNIYFRVFRNLHTSESRNVSGWCETAVTYRWSAPLYRHWGSVQTVPPIGVVEV
jgi:hypothetical protein